MQLNGLPVKKTSSTSLAPFNLFEQDGLDPLQDFDLLGNHDYSSSSREKIMKVAQDSRRKARERGAKCATY